MTVDLPDVPEAAVEAGANALVLFFDVGDATGLHGARLVLAAALPVLVEQGWTPPEADNVSAGSGSVSDEQPFGEWTRHEAAPWRFEPSTYPAGWTPPETEKEN